MRHLLSLPCRFAYHSVTTRLPFGYHSHRHGMKRILSTFQNHEQFVSVSAMLPTAQHTNNNIISAFLNIQLIAKRLMIY